jgi:hypothetical protein
MDKATIRLGVGFDKRAAQFARDVEDHRGGQGKAVR